jgi:hypothetical protein
MERILPDCQTLKHHYVDEEMSQIDIAGRYGVSRATVSQTMKRCHILARGKSAARLLALQKGKLPDYHEFNRGFFRTWRPESAYLLGLAFADGHLTPGGALCFGFGEKSMELLGNMAILMESDKEPAMYDNHGYPLWRLTFASVEMMRDLVAMGMPVGAKSTTKVFPELPDGLERHFVRGYFDGNGSVSWKSKQARFHTGSGEFATGLRNCIWDCFVRDFGRSPSGGTVHSDAGRESTLPTGETIVVHHSFTIVYASHADVSFLRDWMYIDIPPHTALEYKRVAFDELIEMNRFWD